MSMSNNINIRVENKVSVKLLPTKIYIDNKLYCEDMELSVGEHKLYLKSIFKSQESMIVVGENETVLIDFKATLFDKIIISMLCIIITFPFFYMNVKAGYYPIIPALIMWTVLMFSYNPISICNNELKVRKL